MKKCHMEFSVDKSEVMLLRKKNQNIIKVMICSLEVLLTIAL